MCFDNLVSVSECDKSSRSGLYLSDIPELEPLLKDCCSGDVFKESRKRIADAYKVVKNKLILHSAKELDPRPKIVARVGYEYNRRTSSGNSRFQGVAIKPKVTGKGSTIKISSITIPTPKETLQSSVMAFIVDSNGDQLGDPLTIETNKECNVNFTCQTDGRPIYILHETITTNLVMDACTCGGWKQEYCCDKPYYLNRSRRAPMWANDIMVGGVSVMKLSDVCNIKNASKSLNMIVKVELGCDMSQWACANPYNDNSPLDIAIALATQYQAASLIMKAALMDTVISRENLMAKDNAAYYSDIFDEKSAQYIIEAIDYLSKNIHNIDSCMNCKKPLIRRELFN